MLHFASSQLLAWMIAWFYPLCRVAALIGTAPIISDSGAPPTVKIGLSVLITIVIAPTLPAMAAVDVVSLSGLALIVRQLLIGAALGLTLRMVFAAVSYAGDVIGLQMGLGFAQLFDPQHNEQTPVVGTFLGYLAGLTFLALNGHLILIGVVAESFTAWPIDGPSILALDWYALLLEAGMMFALALHLALPVIAALLLTNVALGVLMRSAPQLNLFAIGFPITLLIGAIALLFTLPAMMGTIESGLGEALVRLTR